MTQSNFSKLSDISRAIDSLEDAKVRLFTYRDDEKIEALRHEIGAVIDGLSDLHADIETVS